MERPAGYVPALGYRWLTPLYDAVVRTTTRESVFKQALIAQAGLAPGQQVLDLACGTGTLTVWAARAAPGLELHGLDGDPQVLALARSKASDAGIKVDWRQGLSTELPYPDASFDRVLCSLFFHHLQPADKARTFREVLRVLKPGGELHVADWGRAANPLMRLAFYGIQFLDGFSNTADNVAGRLPAFMEAAGFLAVRETTRYSTLWGTMSLYQGRRH